jgi:hypothetical protein
VNWISVAQTQWPSGDSNNANKNLGFVKIPGILIVGECILFMSEIKHKYFASTATKYSLAYNYIFISLHVSANVGHQRRALRRLDSNVSNKL